MVKISTAVVVAVVLSVTSAMATASYLRAAAPVALAAAHQDSYAAGTAKDDLANVLPGAEAASRSAQTLDIAFTKWVTVPPNMLGVVDGAVGPGTFAGEILGTSDVGKITNITAAYHINGSNHTLVADIQAVQDNSTGSGVITGEITGGWMEGSTLSGEYLVVAECPISTAPVNYYGTMCFQGMLHVLAAGTASDDLSGMGSAADGGIRSISHPR